MTPIPNCGRDPSPNRLKSSRAGGRLAKRLGWALRLALATGATAHLAAGETGSIPYQRIATFYEGFAALKEKDKIQLAVRVGPAKGKKIVGPLRLEIHAAKTNLPVTLSPAGDLADFPLTAELKAENPPIVSNQPKGALSLQIELGIRFSGRLMETGEWYSEALRQANEALASQAGMLAFATPKAKSLVFRFDPGQNGSITVRARNTDRILSADPGGVVRLETDREWDLKGAKLTLSSIPQSITVE